MFTIGLGHMTASLDTNADVNCGEFVSAQQKDRLLKLESEALWLDEAERTTVDTDHALALGAERHRRCGLLQKKRTNMNLNFSSQRSVKAGDRKLTYFSTEYLHAVLGCFGCRHF